MMIAFFRQRKIWRLPNQTIPAMPLVLSILIASLVLLALFIAYRRRRNNRVLTPTSMRLSEREVAELARQSVQRFLQDTDVTA